MSKYINITAIITVFVGLSFFLGWIYMLSFMENFGAHLVVTDIPLETFYAHGAYVFFLTALPLSLWILLAFLLTRKLADSSILQLPPGLARRRLRVSSGLRVPLNIVLALITVLGTIFLPRLVANLIYEQHQRNGFAYYPRVDVWLKNAPRSHGIGKLLAENKYRLLVQDRKRLLLFRPRDAGVGKMETLSLGLADVEAYRMLKD